MNKIFLLTLQFFFVLFIKLMGYGQIITDADHSVRGDVRIMFYNVENFFDAEDDSLFNDSEFLPCSAKEWTGYRFHTKAMNIFKTIAAVGEDKPPEIVCFAEVENLNALKELCYATPLTKYNYNIVHFESPDYRGIDVALIFNSKKISKLESDNIRISFPSELSGRTRDILYFKALTKENDTLHLFVNHWPSRRGGQSKSEPKRMYAAKILHSKIDSILTLNSCAKIIVTGDFNDQPADRSLKEVLNTDIPEDTVLCNSLYNLSEQLKEKCNCGTYKYKAHWNMLDQFVVSGALLQKESHIKTCRNCIHIADYKFLLLEDEKYGGYKPSRTYLGPVYKGGVSDHLPVYLDLFY